nr:ubiquitin hydrolase [Tanacetum cinerariifolium]
MLQVIPTTSDEFPLPDYFPLPVMKIPLLVYFATVSAKEFPLLVHFPTAEGVPTAELMSCPCRRRLLSATITLIFKAEDPISFSFNKWYQSLVKSFDQEKNNIQAQQKKKMDMSWTGLPEFADDTVTDYSRPAPTVESSSDDAQNRNPSVTANEASPCTISPKPFIKFVKAVDCIKVKTNKVEAARKSSVRYAEMYKRTSKSPNVRGNQRNWNNLKSQQLGNNFVMKKKACFNFGDFDHLAYDCGIGVKKGRTCPTNSHKTISPRIVIHKSHRPSMRPVRPNMYVAQPKRKYFHKPAHSYNRRPFQETTQYLVVILIQRVQRLERELKARTPIHKVDRGRSRSNMAWVPKKV